MTTFTIDEIDSLAKLMQVRGLEEMDLYDTDTGEHIKLRMPALAKLSNRVADTVVAPPMAPAAVEAGEEQPLDVECACGHFLEIHHNSAGCLLGCQEAACARKP